MQRTTDSIRVRLGEYAICGNCSLTVFNHPITLSQEKALDDYASDEYDSEDVVSPSKHSLSEDEHLTHAERESRLQYAIENERAYKPSKRTKKEIEMQRRLPLVANIKYMRDSKCILTDDRDDNRLPHRYSKMFKAIALTSFRKNIPPAHDLLSRSPATWDNSDYIINKGDVIFFIGTLQTNCSLFACQYSTYPDQTNLKRIAYTSAMVKLIDIVSVTELATTMDTHKFDEIFNGMIALNLNNTDKYSLLLIPSTPLASSTSSSSSSRSPAVSPTKSAGLRRH